MSPFRLMEGHPPVGKCAIAVCITSPSMGEVDARRAAGEGGGATIASTAQHCVQQEIRSASPLTRLLRSRPLPLMGEVARDCARVRVAAPTPQNKSLLAERDA